MGSVRAAIGCACLLAALPSPARADLVVGGTLDLGQPSPERSVVAPRTRAGGVALVPGRPIVAAVGEPRRRDEAGQVRIVQLRGPRARVLARSVIAGPGRGARAGVALAALENAIIVGAPRARVARRGRPGAVFLVTHPVAARRLRAGDPDTVAILGVANGDRTGAAVAAMPDFDGDARPEILLGAPGRTVLGRPDAGAAYVVPSGRLKAGSIIDLAEPNAALLIGGPSRRARAGAAVAGSLDSDGDLRGEAIVGAPAQDGGSGAAYVVRVTPGAPVDLATPGGPVLALLGADGERAGAAVAPARDLDGDGVRELAVGAPKAVVAGRGRAGVVHIARPGAATGAVKLADAGPVIEGEARGDRAGSSVVQAGNAAGDENPDLIIGAPGSDAAARLSVGAAYIVFGKAAARGRDLGLLGRQGIRLVGPSARAVAGAALAADVDVDGDGRDDVLIGMRANAGRRPMQAPTVLQRRPRLLPRPDRGTRCDAPASVVLDGSRGLFRSDEERLRGSALQLLLALPSAQQRAIGAVEAAVRPADVFLPLLPSDLQTDAAVALVDDLVTESVRRVSRQGNLREALDAADRLNPEARSALVIAGKTASAGAPTTDGVATDVVGVGVASRSAAARRLRRLATGRYARVSPRDLQAQVALFDALRRCERPARATVGGRRRTHPRRVSTLVTLVRPGYEFDASARFKGKSFAELVLTWDAPDVDVRAYELEISRENEPVTTFTPGQVQEAIDGKTVTHGGVSVSGGGGRTFAVLRIDPEPYSSLAVAAKRKKWKVNYGGGSRSRSGGPSRPIRLYTQFFQPD
jgi:hypothetical protein